MPLQQPVLETLISQMAGTQQKARQMTWVRAPLKEEDYKSIEAAAKEESSFDTMRIRSDMLKGNPYVFCRELRYGPYMRDTLARVIVIQERGQIVKIPWTVYKEIFAAFGKCPSKPYWRCILFASDAKRRFPAVGEEPQQIHVNGGYAFPNDPQSIVIYREEESERVLLHELLHACGSDEMGQPVWLVEAKTETWAELFLIAILARGSQKKGKELWRIQSQWIADQEHQLRSQHNVKSSSNYAYRYTVGRRGILESLGIELPPPSGVQMTSLRFTSPKLLQQ